MHILKCPKHSPPAQPNKPAATKVPALENKLSIMSDPCRGRYPHHNTATSSVTKSPTWMPHQRWHLTQNPVKDAASTTAGDATRRPQQRHLQQGIVKIRPRTPPQQRPGTPHDVPSNGQRCHTTSPASIVSVGGEDRLLRYSLSLSPGPPGLGRMYQNVPSMFGI